VARPRANIAKDLIAQASALASDLEVVERRWREDAPRVVRRAFPPDDPGLRPRAIIGDRTADDDASGVVELDDAIQQQREKLLETGLRALEKVREEGEDAELSNDEELGLEAVIRFTARPAIVMRRRRFAPPPPPWEELDDYRDRIETTALSVGRIEIEGRPKAGYAGTGFLVADDVLMTNCHVAREFCALGPEERWVFNPGLTPTVDFVDDPDTDDPVALSIVETIGIHDRLDLALLRVERESDGEVKPLVVASEPPPDDENRKVYVLGYPAPDTRSDPVVMRLVFGDVYSIKRLQPGAVISLPTGSAIRWPPCSDKTEDADVFSHDASTLGGNSGSCVVDLETNLVVGLHFAGYYTKYNQAVALWKLADDPLLEGAGVIFG
jgi:V8-like Glu-specific endopeptidase